MKTIDKIIEKYMINILDLEEIKETPFYTYDIMFVLSIHTYLKNKINNQFIYSFFSENSMHLFLINTITSSELNKIIKLTFKQKIKRWLKLIVY